MWVPTPNASTSTHKPARLSPGTHRHSYGVFVFVFASLHSPLLVRVSLSWSILAIRLSHFVVIMPSASFSRNYCHTYSCLACFSVALVLGVFFISSSRSFLLRRDCSKPSDGAAFSSQQFSWSNTFQTWKQGGLCLTLDKSPKPNAVMEPCSAKTKSGFIAINDVFSFKTKTRAKKAPRVCSVCLLWCVARVEIVD